MGIDKTDYNKIIKNLSGSITQNRFKFQRFWAIKKIYELYETNTEFIVIFDYASDIDVSVNDDLHFYQVKTNKNKNFTIKKLLEIKNKNPKKHSILSNLGLLENYTGVKSLNIVANNYLSEKDKNARELQKICLNELKDEIKVQIKNHIQEKTEITPDLSKYFYIKSDLCLDSTYQTLLGYTVEFLENKFSTNKTRATLFLDWLIRKTEAKTTYEYDTNTITEAIEYKGFTKEEFSKLLENYDSTDNKILEYVTNMIRSYNIIETSKLLRSLKIITESGVDFIRYKNSLEQVRKYILENAVNLLTKNDKDVIEEIMEKIAFDSGYDQYDKKCLVIIGFMQFKEKGLNYEFNSK